VEGSCYAMEGNSARNQAARWQCNRNFSVGTGSWSSGVATEHDLCQTMGKFDMFTESELLQVKIPIVFLVTTCFSRQKGGC
jgi:hypothetical protein